MLIPPANTPFDKSLLYKIVSDLQKQLPREGCGLVIDNEYIPCKNVNKSDNSFTIGIEDYLAGLKRGKIQCLIHSHNDKHDASKLDVQQQISMDIPWGIVNFINNELDDIVFWGDSVTPLPLVGRRFWLGVHDCFSIPRDWMRLKGFTMPNYVRGGGWYKGILGDLIMENLESAGWYIVDIKDIRPGDGILFQILADGIDHIAIYVGDEFIIHQIYRKTTLSRKELLVPFWTKKIKHVVRYKEFIC